MSWKEYFGIIVGAIVAAYVLSYLGKTKLSKVPELTYLILIGAGYGLKRVSGHLEPFSNGCMIFGGVFLSMSLIQRVLGYAKITTPKTPTIILI